MRKCRPNLGSDALATAVGHVRIHENDIRAMGQSQRYRVVHPQRCAHEPNGRLVRYEVDQRAENERVVVHDDDPQRPRRMGGSAYEGSIFASAKRSTSGGPTR